MIAIVDYGVGNLMSVRNMLARLGFESVITADWDAMSSANKLILPGVGAFGHAIDELEARGLRAPLEDVVLGKGRPILGICLGMQLFARRSEEGGATGFGWIDADVVRFDDTKIDERDRIPHMGWTELEDPMSGTLFAGEESGARYYFAHSFHLACDRTSEVTAWCRHGYSFPAAIQVGNVFGVQFHPEKSHRFGMRLLQRFAAA